mmetsp:Transcript_27216/g.65395  ORF Transcript_27216/g.65395 Transcript_27216/m.65395 type:complete len:251 (+) Transcript_27216:1-753(+)
MNAGLCVARPHFQLAEISGILAHIGKVGRDAGLAFRGLRSVVEEGGENSGTRRRIRRRGGQHGGELVAKVAHPPPRRRVRARRQERVRVVRDDGLAIGGERFEVDGDLRAVGRDRYDWNDRRVARFAVAGDQDLGHVARHGLLSQQVIIVITLYGHGDGAVDDHGTPRRREDDVPFDVDVVARGGHAVDAMALGCDRRGRAQADDEHEEESVHHRRRGRWRRRREEGRRWRRRARPTEHHHDRFGACVLF